MKILKMKIHNVKYLCLGMLLVLLFVTPTRGQIRAGSAYLKMLPGAREVGFGGAVSGALDFAYSHQVNPGATAFMREWQWSASYTNWISDIYNTSFLYGRKIRTPWSRHTSFALSVNYLGIPEFNSGGETVVPVSGNNLLATASVGQKLNFISPNISLGGNLKFFNSEMGEFQANAIIFDFGMMARSRRFAFNHFSRGLWDYAIVSAGISMTNLGQGLQFVSERSPLPRMLRSGLALHVGRHRKFQVSLAAEYRDSRDEDGFFLLGSEFSWRDLLSFRAGYSFEDNLLGQFNFGGGLQFDDLLIGKLNPGKNNALKLDLALNQKSAFVSTPYHGSVTHQPIGPEKFEFIAPVDGAWVDIDSVLLAWESSADPDLYDDISYRLIVDSDSMKLENLVDVAEIDREELLVRIQNDSFFVNEPMLSTMRQIQFSEGGDYYWMVLALDKDNHIRFTEKDHRKIAHFFVTSPKPEITAIKFEYSPWITEDELQGTLKFHVKNSGSRTANKYALSIYDSLATTANDSSNAQNYGRALLSNFVLNNIEPNDSTVVEFQWLTSVPGLHKITGEIRKITTKELRNAAAENFYTIPKGIFATEEKFNPLRIHKTDFELPVMGKIYFEKDKAEVREEFIRRWKITPPLKLFAERLRANPDIEIYVQGAADKNSGESIEVAGQRARAVADSLVNLGVKRSQMKFLPDTLIYTSYIPQTDTQWRLEERWRADITTDIANEKELFAPLKTLYNKFNWVAVPFKSTISSPVTITSARLFLNENNLADTLSIESGQPKVLPEQFDWTLAERFPGQPSTWLRQDMNYHIALTDTLNRAFLTRARDVALGHEYSKKERMYYIIAEFNKAKAFYEFYWEGLVDSMYTLLTLNDNMRMKFHGHGCAIGSDRANQIVSERRTRTFQQKFLDDLLARKFDKNNPEDLARFEKMKERIDMPPEGHGESLSLSFLAPDGQEILLGDNNTPLGRQLNRRIMVHLYTE